MRMQENEYFRLLVASYRSQLPHLWDIAAYLNRTADKKSILCFLPHFINTQLD